MSSNLTDQTATTTAGADPTTPPPGGVRVAVHNGHCHHFGICQQEAPAVFRLRSDHRLSYDSSPAPEQADRVRQAARVCPMQAITVENA